MVSQTCKSVEGRRRGGERGGGEAIFSCTAATALHHRRRRRRSGSLYPSTRHSSSEVYVSQSPTGPTEYGQGKQELNSPSIPWKEGSVGSRGTMRDASEF